MPLVYPPRITIAPPISNHFPDLSHVNQNPLSAFGCEKSLVKTQPAACAVEPAKLGLREGLSAAEFGAGTCSNGP